VNSEQWTVDREQRLSQSAVGDVNEKTIDIKG